MYGLVNKAIRDMVTRLHGEAVWERIRHRAGVENDHFLSMEPYPDEMTRQLVAATSTELSMDPAAVLRAFGEYWVKYTAEEGYNELLAIAGESLPDFLTNLDELHARVGFSFPKLVPPSFAVEPLGEGVLRLHYHSTRHGLAPMVIGLLEGLADRFDTDIRVTHVSHRDEGADHDEFEIHYAPRTPPGLGTDR